MYYKTKLKFGGFILNILFKTILLTILTSTSLFAQSGKITGIVVDGELGEPLIGANIMIDGTSIGAASDLNGKYFIENVPEGEYDLVVSSIGFSRSIIKGVRVEKNIVTKIDVVLQVESFTTDDVIITAKAAEDSEAGLLVKRQKSSAVSDAISAEQISRTGSGDAAEAVKQVVGASVVDGKYVYVRGLGDRYSSTQLNGAELPSSDPNRKAFQLDLLPTNLLDNIVTIKTFTPDKPGNFSGGIVDIGTRSFPDAFMLSFSSSVTYHGQATGNGDFLTYAGGGNDWFGSDDGTRSIPSIFSNPETKVPSAVEARFDGNKAQTLDLMSNSFNNILDLNKEAPPVNQSMSLSVGDRITLGKESNLGYLGSFTFGRNFSYYENGEIGIYRWSPGVNSLNNQLKLKDAQGSAESTLGALTSIALNINSNNQISGNVFYSKSGTSTARFQEGVWPQELDDKRIVRNRVMGWVERDVLSYQIRGEHLFSSFLGTTIDWSASFAKTTQDEPDLRLLFSIEDTTRTPSLHTIRGSNFDDPARYFRYLEDNSNTYNINLSIPFTQWSGLASKFKVGAFYQTTDRNFTERIFTYLPVNAFYNEVNGNITELFSDKYNGLISTDTLSNGTLRYNFGNVIRDNSRPRNNYSGDQTVLAGYFMIDLAIFDRLRLIGGIRYETTEIEVISKDTTLGIGNIKENDLLPSLNLVYNLANNMNLRFAATQTLARPTFRELAPFSSKEFVNGFELQGNPGLKRTLIENYDLRWEWFTRPGEILAISGFYKKLKNPIERSFAIGTTESNRIVTYTNVDNATILGAEFEARFRLDHLWKELSNFTIGANLSLVDSDIDIAENELASRLSIDSTASRERDLQGQSNFIVNLDLSYTNFSTGTTASLYFNTFSERLSRVSTNLTPDVFEQPAAQLDLIVSQELFSNFSMKLSVKNILNSSYREVYKYRGQEYIFQEFKRGMTYSVGISYKI